MSIGEHKYLLKCIHKFVSIKAFSNHQYSKLLQAWICKEQNLVLTVMQEY